MRHIVITDQSCRADIEKAMAALTVKASKACIPSTLREIRVDQDECVGLWIKAAERSADVPDLDHAR